VASERFRRPWRIVVMGVSGCGKTTLARELAQRLGVPFVEGDDLHPSANVARMAAGIALTDADREGWLRAIGERVVEAAGTGAVVSCSALKRAYRDRLRGIAPDLRFVYLHGPRELLAARLASRRGHYMPASLLDSQIDTLEAPTADEAAIALDIGAADATPAALARRAIAAL
jgi:carbohydrate kinase (thermoresistant glucokinase family)